MSNAYPKLIEQQGILDLHEHENGDYVITDGYCTDRVVFYDHKPSWACDGLFFINRSACPPRILKALDERAQAHFDNQSMSAVDWQRLHARLMAFSVKHAVPPLKGFHPIVDEVIVKLKHEYEQDNSYDEEELEILGSEYLSDYLQW